MTFFQEEILEPIARYFRFSESLKFISLTKSIILVDIGCGPKIRFFNFAKKHNVIFNKYIGIDPLIDKATVNIYKNSNQVGIYKQTINKILPCQSNSVNYVTAHAFIEHSNHPKEIINEAIRIIKENGKVVLTTPSPKSKGVLEFLAFKLNLLSTREILEHKDYFNKERLITLIDKKYLKSVNVFHRYFLFGFNNLFIITKNKC